MVLSNVNVSRYIRFIMNSQTLRERNFVFEHNGLLFKYKEKIILLGSGQPREVFDLANDESSNTPATVKSAVENDWILTNLTNYNRNNFGRNTPCSRSNSSSSTLGTHSCRRISSDCTTERRVLMSYLPGENVTNNMQHQITDL